MTATMTVAEAAATLGVHRNTIANWINEGRLDAQELPSGVKRPLLAEILRLAEEFHVRDLDELREAADHLDALAADLDERASVLRGSASVLRQRIAMRGESS